MAGVSKVSVRNLMLLASLGALGVAAFLYTRQSQASTDESGGSSFGLADALASLGTSGAEGDVSSGAEVGIYDGYLLPAAYTVGSYFGSGMRISIQGVTAIAQHEALRTAVYYDQAGHATIGYGHKIKPGESFISISADDALTILAADVGVAEDAVNALVRVGLSQSQFDALVSLVFNIGSGNFRSSTLLRRLNGGDYAGALAQFGVWNKVRSGGGLVVSNGLVSRRAAEAALFAAGTDYNGSTYG